MVSSSSARNSCSFYFYVDEESYWVSRICLLVYIILSLILCGGTIFGFTSLKEILLDEGIYNELCNDTNETTAASTYDTTNDTASATTSIDGQQQQQQQEHEQQPCQEQLYNLDSMFTISSSLFSVYLLPSGILLHWLGPRFCYILGFTFVSIGCYLFAITFDIPPSNFKLQYYCFTIAYILIGTGNPLIYIASFNFSQLFSKLYSNVILSICIGCFGFSSFIFYLFHVFYFSSSNSYWSCQELFYKFSILPILMGCIGLFILPNYPYHIQRELHKQQQEQQDQQDQQHEGATDDDADDDHRDIKEEQQRMDFIPNEYTPLTSTKRNATTSTSITTSDTTTSTTSTDATHTTTTSSPTLQQKSTLTPTFSTSTNCRSIITPMKERSIIEQLQSLQFVTQTIFFSWGMLHQNFYLGTIGDQIYMIANNNNNNNNNQHEHLSFSMNTTTTTITNYDDDIDETLIAGTILQHFGIFYPIGCLLSIIPVGTLVRNTSISTSFFVYCIVNVMFSITSIVPIVEIQWMTSITYILLRVGFFTLMSTYSSTIFGSQNLGTMFGTSGCIAGIISLIGTPLLSHIALDINHGNFLTVNIVLCIGSILNFIFPIHISKFHWETNDDEDEDEVVVEVVEEQ